MSEPVLKGCWRSADAVIQRDVLKFWREEDLLPDVADAAKRLKEVCVVAYDGDRIIGALDAQIRRLDVVRARFAVLRVAIANDRKHARLGSDLVGLAMHLLEQWSIQNPAEKLCGIARIVHAKQIDELARQPVWEPTKLTLIGYNAKGAQIRIAWFGHATLD